MQVHFSSKTDNWSTPWDLYHGLDRIHSFTLDVCANYENKKNDNFYSKEIDGLKQVWTGRCFMNPPYGREIYNWVKKAYNSVLVDKTAQLVCCLLPSRTDTKWFHEYCTKGDISFIKGRIKFGDSKTPAPFPSMIVIFKQ